jgi:hypothetical protein
VEWSLLRAEVETPNDPMIRGSVSCSHFGLILQGLTH